jgi:hypothetical protein
MKAGVVRVRVATAWQQQCLPSSRQLGHRAQNEGSYSASGCLCFFREAVTVAVLMMELPKRHATTLYGQPAQLLSLRLQAAAAACAHIVYRSRSSDGHTVYLIQVNSQ